MDNGARSLVDRARLDFRHWKWTAAARFPRLLPKASERIQEWWNPDSRILLAEISTNRDDNDYYHVCLYLLSMQTGIVIMSLACKPLKQAYAFFAMLCEPDVNPYGIHTT